MTNCDHCEPCKTHGCNEHEAVTGPYRRHPTTDDTRRTCIDCGHQWRVHGPTGCSVEYRDGPAYDGGPCGCTEPPVTTDDTRPLSTDPLAEAVADIMEAEVPDLVARYVAALRAHPDRLAIAASLLTVEDVDRVLAGLRPASLGRNLAPAIIAALGDKS
jgi:hypothetical protein